MTEASFQGAVVEYAQLMGWRTYHTFDSRRSDPGFPDLILVRADQLIVAELKTDIGKVSPEQQEWLNALELAGTEVHVWRPRDWNAIFELLKRRR